MEDTTSKKRADIYKALSEFIVRTAEKENAAPAELLAMTEAARIVLETKTNICTEFQ